MYDQVWLVDESMWHNTFYFFKYIYYIFKLILVPSRYTSSPLCKLQVQFDNIENYNLQVLFSSLFNNIRGSATLDGILGVIDLFGSPLQVFQMLESMVY